MTKQWCPRGTQYWSDMDVKLAWGAALVAGKTVTNSYRCDHCGAFHLGHPKPIDVHCRSTGKLCFETEELALARLEEIRAKRDQGHIRRGEIRTYLCAFSKGCGKWHLTKEEK